MEKSKTKIFLLLITSLLLYVKCFPKSQNYYKCRTNSEIIPKKIEEIRLDKKNPFYQRKIDNIEYHDFNIVLEYKNIETEIQLYNLEGYGEIIIESMEKAANTLKSLLKVRPRACYSFDEDFIEDFGFYYWDKEKFGINTANKNFNTCDFEIDLLIVLRFFTEKEEENNKEVISSKILYLRTDSGQPIVGAVMLSKNINYSKINSFYYYKYLFLHAFTHILGFNDYHLKNYFYNYYYTTIDKDGVNRNYINSTKVVQIAKKYFNCNNINGVELEEEGNSIAHWESRILLGEYMNANFYEPEQIISEFTLAYLEDIGYYKVNYYTGGMMQYGRNKGCKFLKEKCVQNYTINPNFENEFYDTIDSVEGIDPSCSSGRQSRAYFSWWIHNNTIPDYYRYFKENYIGGYSTADYCPVSQSYYENDIGYYVGRCSNIGSGDYGSKIYYLEKNETISYRSKELVEITGEKYSNNSFCYLSSLTKENEPKKDFYSKVVRVICYETFCSSKSLTVKIHNNYIQDQGEK